MGVLLYKLNRHIIFWDFFSLNLHIYYIIFFIKNQIRFFILVFCLISYYFPARIEGGFPTSPHLISINAVSKLVSFKAKLESLLTEKRAPPLYGRLAVPSGADREIRTLTRKAFDSKSKLSAYSSISAD